jgi:hypothetical protein
LRNFRTDMLKASSLMSPTSDAQQYSLPSGSEKGSWPLQRRGNGEDKNA